MFGNPYADGKFRGPVDAILKTLILAIAVVVAWYAPLAWYWRIAIFVAIMFVVGIVYPTIQFALTKRKHRRRIEAEQAGDIIEALKQNYPDLKAEADVLKEFKATLSAMNEAYKKHE
jgi:membrane protein implicated in regulation of membrane protease activity